MSAELQLSLSRATNELRTAVDEALKAKNFNSARAVIAIMESLSALPEDSFGMVPKEKEMVKAGQLIDAIKNYRARLEASGMGMPSLKDAKDVIDNYRSYLSR